MRSAMAASSSCCLAWPGGAPPMAFSSSPPPLLLSVAAPHRLPSEPLLPCLRLCPRPCPRPHSPARKALKQEKTVNTDVEAGQGEMEDKAAKEAVPMDGNGNRSSLSDPEAPPLAETLEASSAETLVGSAKTLEADSEALVGSAKALVVDSKTLVNPSETLEAACKTLEVATETLQGASEALVADSETLEVASKTLQGASETLLADSETLEAASGTLVADPKSLAVGTASAPNAASEPARNGKPRMVASPVKDWSQTASLSMNGEKFRDARWKYGTWDLEMFKKDGETAWDDVIDAEVLRRKWLQDRPESTNNDEPVVFESSVIPWWAWVKRFHLPEAELLNGRAAMIGFFMAYVVDSLTGVGLVDQMSSFFGKLLLFIAVVGVMVIRKNEDVKTITEFVKEWSFYDKQWQATWREDPPSSEKNKKDP